MIIYGSRAVHLETIKSRTATCPSCNTQGETLVSVFRKHAHVFWIPLFPLGKTGVSECQHCKNTLETKEMPESIKRDYNKLKEDTKGPIWQFAGLGLIVLMTTWGIYASGEHEKNELIYIDTPQIGDVYEYKMDSGSYSTLKVAEVTNDSVFVYPNEYEISRMSKIYKIDKSENYTKEAYGISRERIKELHTSGEIFDINR